MACRHGAVGTIGHWLVPWVENCTDGAVSETARGGGPDGGSTGNCLDGGCALRLSSGSGLTTSPFI